MKVLVSPSSFSPEKESAALERLKGFASSLVFNPYGHPLTEDELPELLAGCDGYIAGLDFVSKKVIDKADKLKVISRYGSGVDRVDLEAARARNISVCNTPGANTTAVAELTLLFILALARKVTLLDRKTRSGEWVRSTGLELAGKTLGILGLGAIGKAVARRARGFDMKVCAFSRTPDTDFAKANDITFVTLDDLIRNSDIITLHLPLTDQTRLCLSASALENTKRGALLVNTARGGLVDEDAAYKLLRTGHLGGFALDVYEKEPPPKDSPLFTLDNVIATPHTAAHTAEAAEAMAEMSVNNLIAVLTGKPCPFVLN